VIYRFFNYDIPANNHSEFVRRLWASSWTAAGAPQGYMEEVADRVYILEGRFLRTQNETKFVEDLQTAGYLSIIALH
jgi:hypothetical protein